MNSSTINISLKKPFLDQVAGKIAANHKDYRKILLVFPNMRAGLYFRDYFCKLIDKPVWAPRISGIEQFIGNIAGLNLADKISLNIILYNSFLKLDPGFESFDKFFPWGEMLLRDFDEADKYMADIEKLFIGVREIRQIESSFFLEEEELEVFRQFWENVGTSRDSAEKRSFEKLWSLLWPVYRQFHADLKAENLAYDGMAARLVAETIKPDEVPYEHIYFCGFNSLNACEEMIFQKLTDAGKATVIWDADTFYLDDEQNEAGKFIRKYHNRFKNSEVIMSEQLDQPKKISFTAFSKLTGQAKAIFDVLNSIPPEEAEKTAVIIQDERLLLPVLSSVPEHFKDINVTMGYPLSYTPFGGMMDLLIELLISIQNNPSVPADLMQSFLSHPYLDGVAGELREKVQQEQKEGARYLKISDYPEFASNPVALLLRTYANIEDLILSMKEFLVSLTRNQRSSDSFREEYIFHFYKILNRLSDMFSGHEQQLGMMIFLRLLRKMVLSASVPFAGEPVKGLQLMGLLETRTLDFKNVIILGANEGLIPPQAPTGSFIPFSLRKAFRLTTPNHSDSVHAYYFFRLLQRAENVWISYNTSNDDNLKGEQSRFLHMLRTMRNLNISESVDSRQIDIPQFRSLSLKKEERLINKLERYKTTPDKPGAAFSPSALNTYLDCRLKFYLKYGEGLKEPDVHQSTLDVADFGTVFHSVMEEVYLRHHQEFGRNMISKEDFPFLRSLLQNDELIKEQFKKIYPFHDFSLEGKNLLLAGVIKKAAYRMLELDEKDAPFEILGLELNEDKYRWEIPTRFGVFGIKGKIDRLDRKDGRVRIIDYKTGRVKLKFDDIPSLFLRDENSGMGKIHQALQYAGMVRPHFTEPIELRIIGIRESFDESVSFNLSCGKNSLLHLPDEMLNEYQENLKTMIEEIFDENVPFDPAADADTCKYCEYKSLCRR